MITDNLTTDQSFASFLKILERLIIKEKHIALQNDRYECFEEKWADFRHGVYDFNGPDPLL